MSEEVLRRRAKLFESLEMWQLTHAVSHDASARTVSTSLTTPHECSPEDLVVLKCRSHPTNVPVAIWGRLDAAGAGEVPDRSIEVLLIIFCGIPRLGRNTGDQLLHGIRSVPLLPRKITVEARLVGQIFVDFGILEDVRSPVARIRSACRS